MRDSPDFALDNLSQVRMHTWSRGRVVLLGGAAWCPTTLTGLGTSLALVGAYILGGEIAYCRSDHQHALTRYEQRMLPFAPKPTAHIALRAMSMRGMTRWPMKNLIAGQFAKANDLELPDYHLPGIR